MVNREELAALLERVRAATKSDWELNIAIECALPDTRLGEHSHRPSTARGKVSCNYPNGRSSTYNPRRFTYSVDDALTLTERVLPGWMVVNLCEWEATILRSRGPWQCTLKLLGTQDDFGAPKGQCNHAQTPALAILDATLSALIAQAQTP